MTMLVLVSGKPTGLVALTVPVLTGLSLYASTRREELAQTGWPESAKEAFLGQQFTAQHAHYMRHYPDAEWLVVEREAAAIGRLYFVHWSRESRITFMPQARNRGFGSAVLGDLSMRPRRRSSASMSNG